MEGNSDLSFIIPNLNTLVLSETVCCRATVLVTMATFSLKTRQ